MRRGQEERSIFLNSAFVFDTVQHPRMLTDYRMAVVVEVAALSQ